MTSRNTAPSVRHTETVHGVRQYGHVNYAVWPPVRLCKYRVEAFEAWGYLGLYVQTCNTICLTWQGYPTLNFRSGRKKDGAPNFQIRHTIFHSKMLRLYVQLATHILCKVVAALNQRTTTFATLFPARTICKPGDSDVILKLPLAQALYSTRPATSATSTSVAVGKLSMTTA